MLIEIEKKSQTYRFEAAEGEKILYAGLRAGVPLPFECANWHNAAPARLE